MNPIKSQILKNGSIILPEKINWYPGHMHRAINHLQQSIPKIDIFLEIRDSRIPISSKPQEIDRIIRLSQKQKIILFNKFDLCNQRITRKIIEDYQKVGIQCMTIEAKKGTNMNSIIQEALSLQKIKYNTVGLWLMVGGFPNVGKSTLLNSLRYKMAYQGQTRKKIAAVGSIACTTRNVEGFKVCDSPLAYLIDTPGICVPKISNDETALKLSLVGCISDKIPGREILIDYMLYALNKNNNRKYLGKYGLDFPCETSEQLVMSVRNKYHQIQYEVTFDMILKDFRDGKLGNITLDSVESLELLTDS